MAGYLLDTNVIAGIRNSGLPPGEWVGDDDLTVSIRTVEEVMENLGPETIQFQGNVRLLADLPIYQLEDDIADLAERLVAAYQDHRQPLDVDDAVIAATALLRDRTLITRNFRDFHYIEGLSWIDADGVTVKNVRLLERRAPVEGRPSVGDCCAELRRR